MTDQQRGSVVAASETPTKVRRGSADETTEGDVQAAVTQSASKRMSNVVRRMSAMGMRRETAHLQINTLPPTMQGIRLIIYFCKIAPKIDITGQVVNDAMARQLIYGTTDDRFLLDLKLTLKEIYAPVLWKGGLGGGEEDIFDDEEAKEEEAEDEGEGGAGAAPAEAVSSFYNSSGGGGSGKRKLILQFFRRRRGKRR